MKQSTLFPFELEKTDRVASQVTQAPVSFPATVDSDLGIRRMETERPKNTDLKPAERH